MGQGLLLAEGDGLHADPLGAEHVEAPGLDRIRQVGQGGAHPRSAHLQTGEQGVVVAHRLTDHRRPGQGHLGLGGQGVAQGETGAEARSVPGRTCGRVRQRGDQAGPVAGGRQGRHAHAVDVEPAPGHPAQEESQLPGVVPALLRRRGRGEEVREPGPRERRGGCDVVAAGAGLAGHVIEELEVNVACEHGQHPVPAHQIEEPAAVRLAEVVVVAEPGLVGVPEVRRHVQEQDARPGTRLRQLRLEPVPLPGGGGQAGVEQLRVEHQEADPRRRPAAPGRSVPPLPDVETLLGCFARGHGRVGPIADVVVAGREAAAFPQPGGVDLAEGLAHRTVVVGTARELLHHVAQVHDEGRVEAGDGAPGGAGPLALAAARLELQGGAADVDHVVGVGDDDELEVRRRQQAAVEAGQGHLASLRRHRGSTFLPGR